MEHKVIIPEKDLGIDVTKVKGMNVKEAHIFDDVPRRIELILEIDG